MPELKQILIPGIIPIFKPVGPTSHDIIHRLRKLTGVKKIGHAGTLDPLASGVLVVGIGRESTKKLGYLEKTEKEYLAVIRLGACSTTDDQEGGKTEIKKDCLNGLELMPQDSCLHLFEIPMDIKNSAKF